MAEGLFAETERNLKIAFDQEPVLIDSIFRSVKKRNGKTVSFDKSKITSAVFKAAKAVGGEDRSMAELISNEVIIYLHSTIGDRTPSVEEVQDAVEKVLIERGHAKTAKAYILYRKQREILRKKRLLIRNPTNAKQPITLCLSGPRMMIMSIGTAGG